MDLKALYQKKILNQELSLREFAARKTVLESLPSKVQVRIGAEGGRTISPTIFKSVADEVFERAHFVDLLGVDDCFATDRWPPILDVLERSPAINWHTSTFLWLGNENVWTRLARLGMIFGIVVQGATRKAWEAVCDWELGFSGFVRNVGILTRAQSLSDRGMVYFIGKIHRASARELTEFVKLAIDHGVSEVRFAMDPSLETGDMDPDSVTEALELAADNGISVVLGDQRLLALADPELVMRVAKAPGKKVNFPPEGCKDSSFDGLHAWQPLDVKVVDRSRVSVYQRCFKPFHYLSVDIDGRVGPCNHLTEPFLALGDLRVESFVEIWNGQKYQKFRKALLSAQPEDARCRWCFANRISD